MSRRLRTINDWPERAALVRWCVTTLAKDCGVSISTLERYFRETMGTGPYDWLNTERMRRARELLQDDSSVKETASELGFKTAQHFSLAFKKYHGYPPSGFLDLLRRQTPIGRFRRK